ncbi:DUF4123 domain-containing protein [Xenorhabdus sp. 42]|uniref:DUF4123 domain-containing protein n=1 Tax=Xenorhabdus szentirmaii TaxID=290112 RepID=UPI0019ACCC2D|nr:MULTISPECIES: DUF4123 domain-containing protein [unclassified Xenorhabdus]MBD2791581.1 DUF4123 domain-containing protein [Xenorhabdus sp. CUL]MBD2822111.1 DUF4123 domain-containing protein [Xenorhabdus sp. 42]MBD2826846.1 DUF4123 domain-containing protein [Xenorhabdus sp. 5]
MSQEKLYAIIDGAAEPDLFLMLERYDPPSACLYGEPLQPELVKIAPYLIQVDEKVKIWLECRKTPWGIFVHSAADMKTVRQHLRKYLQVLLPKQEKPVFFRFYDPRNIWDFLGVLSDWEVHCFLGPITQVTTLYLEEERTDNFAKIREPFPIGATSKRKMLAITDIQLEKIQAIFTERYIKKLASLIPDWLEKAHFDFIPHIDTVECAWQFFDWFSQNGITDDRNVRGLLQLFITRHYLTLDDLPAAIYSQLTEFSQPGYMRAERVLIQELGQVPV